MLSKKKQKEQHDKEIKRQLTKRLTRRLNLTLQKIINEEELEADTFDPKYMKARVNYENLNNDANIDDILPAKK